VVVALEPTPLMVEKQQIVGLLVFCGVALGFAMQCEGWTLTEGLYWTVVTITTVGYGDYSPVDRQSFQLFGIVFILIGITYVFDVLTTIVGDLAAASQAAQVAASDSGDATEELPQFPVKSAAILWSVLCVGAGFFMYNEGWPCIDAFCKFTVREIPLLPCCFLLFPAIATIDWCVCTATTVGYGDMSLEKESSRAFSIIFVLVSVMSFGSFVGKLGENKLKLRMAQQREKIKHMKLTHDDLMKMDDTDGEKDMRKTIYRLVEERNPNYNKPRAVEVDSKETISRHEINRLT
jgi:hypothetical protein